MDFPPILLATGNSEKQSYLAQVLSNLPFNLTTSTELGISVDTQEDGDSHEIIAIEKAVEWSKASSMLAIASDGGLSIPVLGHAWDSRYTRRFAGPDADDPQKVDRLLELMKPYEGVDRRAHWTEALAIAYRGRPLVSWELLGPIGEIAQTRQVNPVPEFWVFTVWNFPKYGKCYNKLTPQELLSLNDHWTRLGQLVRRFFKSIYIPPLD